jgi:hypothetical protein
MRGMRVTTNDDDPNHTLLRKLAAARSAGTAAIGAAIVLLSLGAFDILSQHALRRATGIADASARFSDWLPLSGVTVEDRRITLATPVGPELDAALPSAEALVTRAPSAALRESETESPFALLSPLPPTEQPGTMTLAAIAPTQDVSIEPDELPNDARCVR